MSVMTFVQSCTVISDGDHLLVDRRSDVLFTSGQRETIACRPTHPNVTVTLKSAWSDEVVALDDNVAFDRRTGFVVRRANSYFDGYFKCLASFDGSASQQMVIITYKGKCLHKHSPYHMRCLCLYNYGSNSNNVKK